MRKICVAVAGIAGVMGASASAQTDMMVSAADPEQMVAVLDMAGYEPELGTDNQNDPMITLNFGGRSGVIYFYGCDEETNTDCDSVQYSVGFDRAEPWPAEEAIEFSGNFRFASVSLDDEGDPYVRWDVITGDGIPAKVFLRSVLLFTEMVEDADRVIFEAERAAEAAAE